MELHYYVADVFTNTPFSGAQIAVFPEADNIVRHDRERIANELNLWETIFINQSKSDIENARFDMNVHTPQCETEIGVHTAVAAAFILAKTKKIRLQESRPVYFQNNGEEQILYITHDNSEIRQTLMSRTVKPIIDHFTPTKEEIGEVLGIDKSELDDHYFQPLTVSSNKPYLVIPVRSLKSLIAAQFNYKAWSISAAPATFAQEILLFSKETDQHLPDFHLRLLGPNIGINEDPPVGAAIPCFAGYLCAHKHVSKGTHIFAVERGLASSRQSILHIEMDNKQQADLTVRVGGAAVMTGQGKIFL